MIALPSHADAYEVLCLQAAADGRGDLLFGESLERARKLARPFMVGKDFPSVYLEFPLSGEPFLDVTMLYRNIEKGTRIASRAAEGTGPLLEWYAGICHSHAGANLGFELDTKNRELPTAAVHFQPRGYTDLVAPFFEAAGSPESATLYLDLAKRMPHGWDLSFFGMFRGRPGSPLRVCGYLVSQEVRACVQDPRYLPEVFDEVGFTCYDDTMLAQARALMATGAKGFDFQFDIFPDGTIGDIFALDAQFRIAQPTAIRESFATGPAGRTMRLLEEWGAADARWKHAADVSFAKAIPVQLANGERKYYSLTLMPQWTKVRWKGAQLQPSKLYLLGKTSFIGENGSVTA